MSRFLSKELVINTAYLLLAMYPEKTKQKNRMAISFEKVWSTYNILHRIKLVKRTADRSRKFNSHFAPYFYDTFGMLKSFLLPNVFLIEKLLGSFSI